MAAADRCPASDQITESAQKGARGDHLAFRTQPWRELTTDTVELLKAGDLRGEFVGHDGQPDWPRMCTSLALRLRNAGRTEREYLEAMTDTDHAVSVWSRQLRERKGRAYAESWLAKRWALSGRMPAPSRPGSVDVLEKADAWLAQAIAQHRAHGRAAATDRRVLESLCNAAIRARSLEFGMAVRPLAECADTTADTAAASIRRLRDAGLIVQTAGHSKRQGARYRLVHNPDKEPVQFPDKGPVQTPDNGSSPSGGLETVRSLHSPHDAWRHSALGPTAGAVYAALNADETTTAEVGALVRRDRSTALRALRRLEEHQLAVEAERGRWVRGSADLDRVARALGVAGRGQLERDRHGRERELRDRGVLPQRTGTPKARHLRDKRGCWSSSEAEADPAQPEQAAPEQVAAVLPLRPRKAWTPWAIPVLQPGQPDPRYASLFELAVYANAL